MEWISWSREISSFACTCTHIHTHIIHRHLWDTRGQVVFNVGYEKSWRQLIFPDVFFFICIPGAASASSYCQSFLFECQHYYYSRWCNSRCLSACLSCILCLSFSVFVPLSQPLLLCFPIVLFNSCHYVSAKWNPLGIHFFYPFASTSIFLGLTFYHSFPTHSECNGWNRESSLLLSCLSFPIVYSESPDSVASDLLWINGHFDISHPEMWQRMVLLVNTVHYCLDSWWPRFNPAAPSSADTAHKWDFLAWGWWHKDDRLMTFRTQRMAK